MVDAEDSRSDGSESLSRDSSSSPADGAASDRRWLARLKACLPPGSLERRLFLTVFIGLLPLALLSFVTLIYNAQSQKDQVLRAAVDTMRAVITAVDAELEESIAALDALAASPRLARGDIAGFRHEALELLARRPVWENIVLYDGAASAVMNARAPAGAAPPPTVDKASVKEAIASGEPQVTNLVSIASLGVHAFAVRVPVERHGRIENVLTAAISPDSVQAVLMRQSIPEGGVVAIFDRNYNVVARSSGYDEWRNGPGSPGMLRLLEEGRPSGWGTTSTLEGISVYSVYYRSAESGWSAAVGIPTTALDGPIMRSYTMLGGSILVSALLGLFVSALVARTITGPMRELVSAAKAVGKGQRPDIVHTSLPEIRHAAEALSSAHTEREALLQRERQARLHEQEARELAERANRAKDEFLAMLGHELRNPLAAISTAARLLDSDRASQDAARRASAIIQRQSSHLAQLTDDLLDTGRVVMGKIQVEREPLDLAAVVRHALDTLADSDRLSGHDVGVSLDSVWIEGDAVRLEQVVANLMTNAVKYTPAGGRIRVSVERDGDEAVLRVRDYGLGLEPDLLPHVFDLFVQGRRTLDRSQGGLGIGLTLVRRLIELHDGRVAVTSQGRGKGSEFVVRLPAIDERQVGPCEVAVGADVAPRTVVVVEDNADVRTSLTSLLELKGHRVLEAADGPSGVETILRESPDVAIVDIGLPELDGYGVARAVRDALPKARLIALTGYGVSEERRDDGSAFDEYLVKPVDPELLDRLINAAAETGTADRPSPKRMTESSG